MIGVFWHWLQSRNHLLPLVWICFSVVGFTTFLPFSLIYACVFCALCVFWSYIEFMVQLSFRAPINRKPPLQQDPWILQDVIFRGRMIRVHHVEGAPEQPTLILTHGWTSGASRMVKRAQPFLNKNWTVVMIDLPGHGISESVTKWTAEYATSALIESLRHVSRTSSLFENRPVFYYGHSMGAFIGFRLSERRLELPPTIQFHGWIMESPMTGYSDIFIETCDLLRIPSMFRPIVLRRTISQFNSLNQNKGKFTTLDQTNIPLWGMMKEPILLVQATPDERLGDLHHERLTRVVQEMDPSPHLTVHPMKSLTHSGAAEHHERDGLVNDWVEEMMTHSSP